MLRLSMCKELFFPISNLLLSGAVRAAIVTGLLENSRRKKQNKYQDAKANLPILMEILEDLNILEQAYIFRGVFCRLLEHRCPQLSADDVDGVNNMSYSQRAHQFRLIGYRIIRNCSKIIFLTPAGHLPKVLEVCRNIKIFFYSKKRPDSNTHLELNITILLEILQQNRMQRDSEIKEFTEKLHQLYADLDAAIVEELPLLSQ